MLHNRRKERVMFLCPGSQSVPPVSLYRLSVCTTSQSVPPVSLYHHPPHPPVPWRPMSTKKKEVEKANTYRTPIVPDSGLWTRFSPVYLALLPSRPLQQKPRLLSLCYHPAQVIAAPPFSRPFPWSPSWTHWFCPPLFTSMKPVLLSRHKSNHARFCKPGTTWCRPKSLHWHSKPIYSVFTSISPLFHWLELGTYFLPDSALAAWLAFSLLL